jgi:hypothetical protein
MHDRPELISAAIGEYRTRSGQRTRIGVRVLVLLASVFEWSNLGAAQDLVPPAADLSPAMGAAGIDTGAPPVTQSGDVSYFSQDLGTILRLQFRTESYGQDGTGNFDIGTMQVVTMDDTAAFFDGQVTMNESDGVGFNIGLGYRWMSYPDYAVMGRMEGFSLWADGTHTDAGNFFPQVGVSLESLGETWEFRANGYIPVGQREQVGAFKPTGGFNFTANALNAATQATVDRSFYAGDLEVARRMGPNRDAWAFAGPYFVANDEEDSAGVRVGVRGYAYPDLLLQFALSHDDVFDTNATFSIVWFVGRTRTNFQPACNPADNFRRPVMRNDYVVLSHHKRAGGTPLSNEDGTQIRVVHVDSNAPAGGDGTVEHPFDNLTDVNAGGSQKGDIILAHSTSVFTGESSVLLKDNQRLLGEGNNLELTVPTKEKGDVILPESSPGARALARPMIVAAIGDAVVLADNNEVANFDMDGQNVTARGIAAGASGAGNPDIHDMSIKNTTGDAVHLTPLSFVDVNDTDNDTNTTETIIHGNVTIDKLTLDNIGGNGVDITGTNINVPQPDVTLQETIALSNITSTNGAGRGIAIRNTHDNHTTTLTGYTYDGGTTSQGGLQLDDFKASFNGSNSTLRNGATTGQGVQILGDSDGAMTFTSSFTFANIGGTVVDINGDAVDKINGDISFAAAITKTNNNTGHSISVQNLGTDGTNAGSATFAGDVTDTAQGILVQNNTGGTINLNGDLTLNTDTENAFVATGGGTLNAAGTNNTVRTTTGQDVVITGMTIGSDVRFAQVNRSVASAATAAIQLENNTGGGIELGTVGTNAGDSGVIEGGTVDAIQIKDSANATVSGIRINNTAAVSGVRVEVSNANASVVNLNRLETNGGDIGVETVGGGTGVLTMTVNDTAVNNATVQGMLYDSVRAGTIQVNSATVNTPAADAVVVNNVSTINFQTLHVVNAGGDAVTVTQTNTATGTMDVTLNELTIDAATGNGLLSTADSTNVFKMRLTNSTLQENVSLSGTGAGNYQLLVDNTDITTAGAIRAFALTFGGAATSADVTIRNQNNFTAANANALFIDNTGATNPMKLNIQNSTFVNSSAANAAGQIFGDNTSDSEVTIQGNTFQNNNGAGEGLAIQSRNSAKMNLLLGGAGSQKNTGIGVKPFHLTEDVGSTFKVFEAADTFAGSRNNGAVTPTPAIGDFDNLGTPPPLPTVP